MPVYDFRCEDCGDFRSFLDIDRRNDPVECPSCTAVARRRILAPNLAMMNPVVRNAHTVNERSRHEPKVRESHQCGSGCGCSGKRARPARTQETKLGRLNGQKASARPWMLGH